MAVEGGEGAEFSVNGISLGQVQLTASVSYSGRQISSQPQAVTVFPPVILEPRNISLVIGAAFQFTHSGGPADCSLQFSVGDFGLASTNQEGLVTALALGSTSLTVTAVDSEGKVYSRDTVNLGLASPLYPHLLVGLVCRWNLEVVEVGSSSQVDLGLEVTNLSLGDEETCETSTSSLHILTGPGGEEPP